MLPLTTGADPPDAILASLWRRPNGHLRAGLAVVVSVGAHGSGGRFVTRSIDGSAPVTVTTTCSPIDGGCLVEQQLEGSAPAHAGDRVTEFAQLWVQRGLIALKEQLEAGPTTGLAGLAGQPGAEGYASRLGSQLDALDEVLAPQGLVPISHDQAIEVAMPPDQLWELLTDPGVEHLLRPSTRSVSRVQVPGITPDVLVALHDDDHGHLSLAASHLTELRRPDRIVERSLTSEFELAVVTQIEPLGAGSLLTESLVGSIPAGSGALSGAGPAAALVRTRLEVLKHLAEAGVHPPRDPRTGFLPPGSSPPQPDPEAAPVAAPPPVLLPPPHLPIPVPTHRPPVDWDWHGLESI